MALRPQLGIQWHITNECSQDCKHCYLKSRNAKEKNALTEPSLEKCLAIIENYSAALDKLGATGSIDLTGGDPLLYEHIWDVMGCLRKKNLSFSILGNSYEVNDSTAAQLKDLELQDYQLSLDGLEQTHDWLRKKGSFADSLRAFDIIQKHGIKTGIMFTISRQNKDELIPVMRLAAQKGLDTFAFDAVTPNEQKDDFKKLMLSPLELRTALLNFLQESDNLARQGYGTIFARKNNLHMLILEEKNHLIPVRSDEQTIFAGCPIGQGLTLCADGRVIPCPRIPITIGKLPEDDICEILLYSEFLNKFRQRDNFKKCSRCSLFQYCRGCPANAYALYGDCFTGDPYCWKEIDNSKEVVLPRKIKVVFGKECGLSDQEREIIGTYYAWQFKERSLKNEVFQEIIGRAFRNAGFRKELEEDIEGTCIKYNYRVSEIMLYELSRVEMHSFFNVLG